MQVHPAGIRRGWAQKGPREDLREHLADLLQGLLKDLGQHLEDLLGGARRWVYPGLGGHLLGPRRTTWVTYWWPCKETQRSIANEPSRTLSPRKIDKNKTKRC